MLFLLHIIYNEFALYACRAYNNEFTLRMKINILYNVIWYHGSVNDMIIIHFYL